MKLGVTIVPTEASSSPAELAVATEERGQIADAVSIRERPAGVEDRAVPGHWEGDLLSGSNDSHVTTRVERQARFTMLVKVQSKDTQTVVKALRQQVRRLPAELRRSLTWARGFPRGTDLSACSQADLNRTGRPLNQRPRETLAFRSPGEGLDERVASTG